MVKVTVFYDKTANWVNDTVVLCCLGFTIPSENSSEWMLISAGRQQNRMSMQKKFCSFGHRF